MAAENNPKLMGALAYLLGPITGILFLLMEKGNKFVRFHAMQSTILFGGLFVVNIVLGFYSDSWMAGKPCSFHNRFCFMACFDVEAYNGEEYEVPYIGK